MAVDDLYQVKVSYHLPGAPVTIAFQYIQTEGGNDIDTLQSAVDYWVTNRLPELLGCLAEDVDVDQVRMDQVEPQGDLPGLTNLVGSPGTVAGQAMPAGGAAVITWVTEAPNAKHNGRFYLAGISETEVTNGIVSDLQKAEHLTFSNGLILPLLTSLPQDAVFKLATISRWLDKIERVTPVGFLVESQVIRGAYYSQRRRITNRLGLS